MRVVDDMDKDPEPRDTPPPPPPPSGYLNAITLSSLEKKMPYCYFSHIHCKQRVFLRKCFLQVRKCIFTFIQDIVLGKDFFERN